LAEAIITPKQRTAALELLGDCFYGELSKRFNERYFMNWNSKNSNLCHLEAAVERVINAVRWIWRNTLLFLSAWIEIIGTKWRRRSRDPCQPSFYGVL